MRKIIILFYFIVGTIFITYPLINHMQDGIFGYGDELLETWIMNWDIHAFFTDPAHIYNAPLYYPYQNTLAYSDTFFTSALLAVIPSVLWKEPMTAYNFTALISVTTLGFFTYLLIEYLTNDTLAGLLGGTLFAYSTFTLERLSQLQVVSLEWIPLCLLFFFIYLEKKSFRYLLVSDVFFLLQLYNSIMPGYFIAFSITIIVFYFYVTDNKILIPLLNKRIIGLAVLTAFFVFFLTYPYFQVANQFHYVRDIRDTINFANRPEYWLYPNINTRLLPILSKLYQGTNKLVYDGYFGFALLFLSIVTIVLRLLNPKRFRNKYLDIFLLIAVCSFILSLGPAFQWNGKVIKHPFMIPLPYAVFYYVIPGFKGIRNSARWELLTVLSLSMAIGIFFSELWKKSNQKLKIFTTIVFCGLVFLEYSFPRKIYPIETYSQFPPVYRYLSQHASTQGVLELPFYNWNMSPYAFIENRRMYYSILGFPNRMNGGSGYSPQEWQDQTFNFIYNFPDTNTFDVLKNKHIVYLVLHKAEYDRMEQGNYTLVGRRVIFWNEIQKRLKAFPEISKVAQFGNDYIYKINYEEN